jgi:hypothetical protein
MIQLHPVSWLESASSCLTLQFRIRHSVNGYQDIIVHGLLPYVDPTGMVTNCNVTMTDQTSGIMGLGFPRLSSIVSSVTNCMNPQNIVFSLLISLIDSHPIFCGLGTARGS